MAWRWFLRFWQFASLIVLAPAILPSCTPAQSPTPRTEWAVANQTPDTLWVVVRYALDSIALSPAGLREERRQMGVDSLNSVHWYGYYQPYFLRHITRHRGQWYLVQHTKDTDAPVYYADADSRSAAQAPRVNLLRGELTYRVPPAGTQHLLDTETTPVLAQAEAPLLELRVHQRGRHVAVLPRLPLLEVFQRQYTGSEHGYAPRYRRQLTVGPGLALNL